MMFFAGSRTSVASLYPSLDEYMGLDLRSNEVQHNLAVVPTAYQPPAVVESCPSQVSGFYQNHN